MHHSIAHIYIVIPSVIVKTSMCLYIHFWHLFTSNQPCKEH